MQTILRPDITAEATACFEPQPLACLTGASPLDLLDK